MKNKNGKIPTWLYAIAIILTASLLFSLWGLFFRNKADQTVKPDTDMVEENQQPTLEIKDYKVYKFDNVDYRFILTNYHASEQIDLKDIKTSENVRLDQVSELISSLKTLGFKLNDLENRIDSEKDGVLFIPVYDNQLENLELNSEKVNITEPSFNLSKVLEDKSLLGFVEEKPNDSTSEDNIKPNENESGLKEIDPNQVLIDGVKVGYPSNVRIFIIETQLTETASPINSAVLTFKESGIQLKAQAGPFSLADSKLENILNRNDIKQGFLLFEFNNAQQEINNLDYTLEMEGGQ